MKRYGKRGYGLYMIRRQLIYLLIYLLYKKRTEKSLGKVLSVWVLSMWVQTDETMKYKGGTLSRGDNTGVIGYLLGV